MDEKLITKKELLDCAKISYGSLYRWKRKNLIPNEWFIHRSTFTGHETFFPRDKIIERINKIVELKETMSLDDIAAIFNPGGKDISMSPEEIDNLGIISGTVINLYLSKFPAAQSYDFDSLFPMFLFASLIKLGTLSREDAFLATEMVINAGNDLPDYKLILTRKLGVCTSMMLPENNLAFFDKETSIVAELGLNSLRSDLTEVLGNIDKNT